MLKKFHQNDPPRRKTQTHVSAKPVKAKREKAMTMSQSMPWSWGRPMLVVVLAMHVFAIMMIEKMRSADANTWNPPPIHTRIFSSPVAKKLCVCVCVFLRSVLCFPIPILYFTLHLSQGIEGG